MTELSDNDKIALTEKGLKSLMFCAGCIQGLHQIREIHEKELKPAEILAINNSIAMLQDLITMHMNQIQVEEGDEEGSGPLARSEVESSTPSSRPGEIPVAILGSDLRGYS